jgi:NAD(P)H-hydrate epimerase
MAAADAAAAKGGVPTLALMEAAGAAVAKLVQERWRRRRVVVLAGPGNNGGDGFVAARLLAEAGWDVRIALLGDADALKGDAKANVLRWRALGRDVLPLTPSVLDKADLVIDAIFGAGLNRGLDGAARATVTRLNEMKLPCVGVDIPSGVSGDTGEVRSGSEGEGIASICAATVTFFRPKPGHLLYPGRALCGELAVADIGIPDSVLDGIDPKTAHNRPGLWKLPEQSWHQHKYDRGSAIIVGGNEMTGAARLAARGARRIGAGLVTFAVAPQVVGIYAMAEPGALVQPIAHDEDLEKILADKRRNGVLIGPGSGRGPETCARTLRILATDKAVVLDADALTSFADDPAPLFAAIRERRAPVVITPHAGEFARLLPRCPGEGKLARARAGAAITGAVVVLKGPDTVVAAPDGRAALSDNAPPWLATGGAGDVLAGFVLGLMVQQMDAFEAACAAVWLHGAAAGRAGRGLIAEDLPEALPKILELF